MQLYSLLGLLYIVRNTSVPTYPIQELVYNPIRSNSDVFHIAKLLIFENVEPKQASTNREASTAFAASIN